jgi:Uncharacterized protein conserved in bacteria
MHFAIERISYTGQIMQVEVVYALPERQAVVQLEVPEGTTVYQAAVASKLADQFPDIDLETIPMGVFGVRVKTATTTILHPGDRVELYRSLIADPKENRRSRAESQRLDPR